MSGARYVVNAVPNRDPKRRRSEFLIRTLSGVLVGYVAHRRDVAAAISKAEQR